MNNAVCTNRIWGLFLHQGLKTGTATKHRWSIVGAHANNVFPPDTMHLKKSIHFVEYFPCGYFGAEGVAKQNFVFQIPIHNVQRSEVGLSLLHPSFCQFGSQKSKTMNFESLRLPATECYQTAQLFAC